MGPLTVAERGVFGAERVKWEVGMFGWASRGGRMAQPVWEDSGGADVSVVLVGQRLVEHEVRDWFGLGGRDGLGLSLLKTT